MCSFVPGQVIAIGPKPMLTEIGDDLPGRLGPVIPLVGEGVEFDPNSEFGRLASVVLKTDPGMELYAMSRLSARLSGSIERNEAAVDLNHILPLATPEPFSISSLRLSPHGEREASAVRRLLRSALPAEPLRIAVLDSGLAPDFAAHRELRYFDYTSGGRLKRDVEPFDPLGHGTRVASILDQILPPEVNISIGRLPSDPGSLTALTVAHALGDIIARETPDVVNLSVCLRNDWFVCPHCKQRVPASTFLSSLLPIVVRLGGKSTSSTLTVMAAGNTGQAPNSRWLTDDVDSLLFAFAENRRGERALYSSAPDGPRGDLYSVGAFGGDDPSDPDAQGVFIDGAHGTSFAAPFVSAVSLLTKRFNAPMVHGIPSRVGLFTREVIEAAREGRLLRFRAAGEER
ncbi:S8/S53 family peptidase [Burkholderia ubonensis]|uniref:S8/S53 family peptidase n=1 Tax=Burkholderia ubonensis TaxID=101571 RepID=UPI000B279304|nr:S8/S53 family peptidase [Burkholderia ubonensis]